MSTSNLVTQSAMLTLSAIGARLLAYAYTLEPDVIFGAFLGATLYVASEKNNGIGKFWLLIYFLCSFSIGLSSIGEYVANYIGKVFALFYLPMIAEESSFVVDHWIGALIASGCSVNIIFWMIHRAKQPIKTEESDK